MHCKMKLRNLQDSQYKLQLQSWLRTHSSISSQKRIKINSPRNISTCSVVTVVHFIFIVSYISKKVTCRCQTDTILCCWKWLLISVTVSVDMFFVGLLSLVIELLCCTQTNKFVEFWIVCVTIKILKFLRYVK